MNHRILCLAVALLAAPALAVSTSYWTQTNENDFKAGTLDSVVATNLGELKLSRAVKTLLEEDPRISTVNNLAEGADGVLYAGTGPNAILLQIKDQKVTTLAQIPDATDILSLAVDRAGRVLIGTGGQKGQVLRIDKAGEKPHSIFAPEGAQYIWALKPTADGKVYAATGPAGKLYELSPDGASRTLLETDENNLLSLATDGKDLLYVGTDPHGLVYRVNRKTGESFVLYNAAESEVTALALDADGNLYAATGAARDEPPAGPPAPPDEQKNGRLEGGTTGVPIPGGPPDEPKPPTPPDPNPGRPNPIPKAPASHDSASAPLHHLSAFVPASLRASVCHSGQGDVRVALADADDATDDAPTPKPPKPPFPDPSKPQPTPDTAPSHEPGVPKQPAVDVNGTGEPKPEGNAVYKIDPQGFVTEIFRQPVLVLAMVENHGTLLIATGSAGEIYQVDPRAGETVALAKVDAKQITCLLLANDGQIYMGMANVGSIAAMSNGFASRGTYVSQVLDAAQISRFGKMQLHGSLPPDTSLRVSTRSGNVKEASDKTWSKWKDDVAAAAFVPVTAPSARFLQYRLTLESRNPRVTPVVDDVTTAYQIPNLPPQVKSVRTAFSSDAATQAAASVPNSGGAENARAQATPIVTITWEATDPNSDALVYSLYFRREVDGPWILMKDKLTESTYEWDTRLAADGRYQIKVVASDAAANPPGEGKSASRISDPVVVDNTPPIVGDLKWSQVGAVIHVDLRAADRSSTVAAVEYAVDSSKDWQLVLPVDKIYDAPEATVRFDVNGLSPGPHQVTLRATDSRGNQAFESLIVKVEPPAASR